MVGARVLRGLRGVLVASPDDVLGGSDVLETIGAGVLRAGQAHALDADVVHSVMNRWAAPNGVVHVYGGNFLAADRHIWDPVTGERHRAGMSEPLVPVDGATASSSEPDGPALAGTAFAALAVSDLDGVSSWLSEVLGLRSLTMSDDTCQTQQKFVYLVDAAALTVVGLHQEPHIAGGPSALDHLALRVSTLQQRYAWHDVLEAGGHGPGPITDWRFGTSFELRGPEASPSDCSCPP
jgi:hypothetical protein